MAMKWKDVEATSEYQDLDRGGKKKWREEYFNEVVAPNYDATTLPSARKEFDSDTKPTLEKITDAGSDALDTVATKIGNTVRPYVTPKPKPAASAGITAQSDTSGMPELDGGIGLDAEVRAAVADDMRQAVPVTVRPGQEAEWLARNKPKENERMQAKRADVYARGISAGAARLDEQVAAQNAENVAEAEAVKADPNTANLKSGLHSASGGLYGAMAATASNLSPYGEEGYSAKKLLELSNKMKDWGKAIQSDASKQNFADADSKMGWMADQFLLNAPSSAVTLASIFSPTTAPYALGTMAAYSGGGHYTDLVNAGVDNRTASLAALAYGATEAAIERAIPIELGQEVLRKFKVLAPLGQAEIGRRIVRGVSAGTLAAGAMGITEGGEELVTGIIQRSIDKVVKQAALNNGQGDVAAKVGNEDVYGANAMINDTMGGIAGGAPVAGAVGGRGGYLASLSRDALIGQTMQDDVASRDFAPGAQPMGAGPSEADYRAATQAAFAPRAGITPPTPQGPLARVAAVAVQTGLTQQAAADQAVAIDATDLLDTEGANDAGQGRSTELGASGNTNGGDVARGSAGAASMGLPEGGSEPAGTPGADSGTPVVAGNGVQPNAALIDTEANKAATSPLNNLPQPTDAQKKAGNYKKGMVSLNGIAISIENPEGSTRSGVDEDGKAWETKLANHYGYVRRTTGADGDNVDVFIGKNPDSQHVFVVDQINPKTGKFDEHKAMLGFDNVDAALAAYKDNYHPGWTGAKNITSMTADQFKGWLAKGDTTKPLGVIDAKQPIARVGSTPTATEDVTVKDGVVYLGKFPAQDFETGEDITVGDNPTFETVSAALRAGNAIGGKQKIYGGPATQPVPKGANPFKQAFATLTAGSVPQGVKDPAQAKAAFDAGKIKSAGDLRRFEEHGYPAPPASRLKAMSDTRLADAEIRGLLPEFAKLAGWSERGGHILRDANTGEVTGRTKWIPNAEWWEGKPAEVTEKLVRSGVPKALNAQPITKPEREAVEWLLSVIEADIKEMNRESVAVANDIADDADEIPFDVVGETDTRKQMESMGFTQEEINETLEADSGKAEEVAARPAQEGDQPGNETQATETTEAPELNLVGQTTAQITAADTASKKAAEKAARADAKPSGPDVTSDQVDMFNTQGGLFNQSDPKNEFIKSPDGSIDFGAITTEQAATMNRQAGKIRLTQGIQNADGTGYGLVHIEANHGKQIRNAGFDGVQEFVAHVASNFNEILQASGKQLLVAVDGGRKDVMFVQLEPDSTGDFYRINSAFPASRDYLGKQQKKGMKVLWGGSEPASTVAGQQPLYAGTPENKSGQDAPIAQGQSNSTIAQESASKLLWGGASVPTVASGADSLAGTLPNAGATTAMTPSQSSDGNIAPEADQGKAKPITSKNTIFTEDAAAAARAILKKKLSGNQLNTGIDPEVLQAGLTLAGYHIENGARSFAAYAKAMIADLGDAVKPYLKSWYAAISLDPRAAGFDGMDSLDSLKSADVDALTKPETKPAQADEDVRQTAKDAGITAAADLFDWKSKQATRAKVKVAILNSLTQNLPQSEMDGAVALADEIFEDVLALAANDKPATTETGPTERVIDGKLETSAPEVEHITSKGKSIKGVIAKTLTLEQARAIDLTSWKKDGGIFIHMKHVARPEGATLDKPKDQATNTLQEALPNDAGNLSEENLPSGSADSDTQQRPAGDGTGESLDAGLAGASEGTDSVAGVSDGVQKPARAGNRGAGDSTGQPPSSGNGNYSDVRAGDGTADSQLDHTISDEDGIGDGGLGAKYRDNIAAIKIIKELEDYGRLATPEQRKALTRYVGWGALKGVFDPNNKTWTKQHAELRALLTDAEWAAASKSQRNAHYTSPVVIKSMYGAIDRLGFKGGRILEPSMGSGNFFGMMPAAMRNKSKLHGVELDSLTSRLAKALYPNAVIATATGFQDYSVPAGYFDMAYGNPPFGSEPVVDRERNGYSGFSIHNYFIARMIDKTRDGGIVPVIVSHSFMDAINPKAREWIAARANLLGAVRLPNTAFKNNAGTEVVTDILFFQKTATPEKRPAWTNVSDIDLTNAKTGEKAAVSVNDYFKANPGNVLGKPSLAGSMYRANSYTVEPTGDLAKQLQAFVDTLPENVYQPGTLSSIVLAEADNTVPDGVKVGSYYLDTKGAVRQRNSDVAGMTTSRAWEAANDGAARRMRSMMELRDLLRRQMRDELSDSQGTAIVEANRKELNQKYDAFVKTHGFLNSQINRRIFLDDTESALLQALEFDYDAGTTKANAEKSGLEEKKPSAVKADILKRRVLYPPSTEIKVTNAKDALLAALNEKGRADMEYMASTYGKTEKEIVAELGDVLFNDPQTGYATSDEYLSGDVKTKLDEARAAAANDAQFERNVKALEKVIPEDKTPSSIFASIGVNWIPKDVYQQFAGEITGNTQTRIDYLAPTAQWFADMEGPGDQGKLMSDFGTSNINSFDIFKLMLNGRAVEVKKKAMVDGKERSVTDEEATEAARQRMDKIKQHWESWVWNDAARAERLAGIYNAKHNRIVKRAYDGAHLSMPGMSRTLELRTHQKNVIWRAIQERNVLMDHVVGAGKTFAMVGTIMEMKRLAIARKPLFAVPNHLTLQWRSEFSRMYPSANVLAATPEDFSKDNRERMFAKIATGEYDAVVVGHSSLKKIGLDPEIESGMLQEQIKEIADAIEALKSDRGDRNTIRDMEKIKANLEAKINALVQKAGERDKVVTFDELGVDALIVDEMHEFKNLFFYTQKQRVSGLGNPKGSGKAFDLFMKVRWMQQAIGDKVPLITATGTPVSNSLSEMFTMQRFMRYDELKRDGLHQFDAWSRMYGEDEYVYEVAPSGVGYRISQRFSKFKNLPSLMGHYQSFADVVTLQDLKDQSKAEGKRFPVPKMVGGRQQNIVAKRSDLQRDFFGVPVIRRDESGKIVFQINDASKMTIEANPKPNTEGSNAFILSGNDTSKHFPTREDAELALAEGTMTPVLDLDPKSLVGQFNNLAQLTRSTKGKINALSLTGLASKAGLDYRLIDPSAPDFPGSKINMAVAKIVEIHKQWDADKGTQLVFCDLSVPLSAKAHAAKNEKRLYVLDDAGELTHKKGTLHTVEGFGGFPFYLVRTGKGSAASVTAYEPLSGKAIRSGLADKDAAKAWAAGQLSTEAGRDQWFTLRDRFEQVTAERISEYRDAAELDVAEDGSNEISMDDLEAIGGAGAFSVYDDIKAKLIARGIRESEIAFIHDYHTPKQKEALFKRVNAGDIRILMGSTPKLGAGTNVQQRLVGLHHIDAPWRPSDLEQREGRIIRQGNTLYERDPEGFEVFIGRYATEQTYDTRRWQLLEHKASGIEQLRKYSGENEIEDVAGEASNAADMKAAASGNPLILEETKLRTNVKRLTALRRAHEDGKFAIHRRIQHQRNRAETFIPEQLKDIDAAIAAAAKSPDTTEKGGIPSIVVGGKTAKDKAHAEKMVGELITRARAGGIFGSGGVIAYRGVEFTVDSSNDAFGLTKLSWKIGNIGSWIPTEIISSSGVVTRMGNAIDRLPDLKLAQQADLAEARNEIESLSARVDGPFDGAADLAAATAQHTIIQRRLMKSTQMDAVQPSERAEFMAALDSRKQGLIALGYAKAVKEATQDDNAPSFSRGKSSIGGRALLADQSGADTLNNALVNYGLGEEWRNAYEAVAVSDTVRGVGEEIQAAFGRDVRFVAPTAAEFNIFNGFRIPEAPEAIYVNAEADVGFINIAGHELLHDLKRRRPDLYDWFSAQAQPYLRDVDQYQTRLNKLVQPGEKLYDNEAAIEELLGDFTGDSLTDPEFLQQLADSNPTKFKQFVNTVRMWLTQVANKLRGLDSSKHIADVKALQKHLGEVLNAFAEGKPIVGTVKRTNDLSAAWKMLAGDDTIFQNPIPDSFDMEGAAKEIDPGMSAVVDKPDLEEQKAGITKKWYVKMPDGTNAYVMENAQGEVWLDASRLKTTSSGGTKLYLLVGSYAEGNSKVFIGDPAGLSDAALLRRTENMLSLALRFGKTDFMRPHEYQSNPHAKYGTGLADVVRPINWVEGDDTNNLEELIKTSYSNTVASVPEIKDVTYNFDKQRFERNGTEFTDQDFAAIEPQRNSPRSNAVAVAGGAGRSATLKRAAITNTLARAKGGQARGRLLAEISAVLSRPGGLENSHLEDILYSRQQKIPGTTTPQPPQITRQPPLGLPPGTSGNQASWNAPENTGFDNLVYKLQNKNIDLKRVIESVKKTGAQLADKWDAYLQEELFHGRAAKRTLDFVDRELNPLLNDAKARGLTLDEIDQYLHARHAKEANDLIASRDPAMTDGGSGMPTADAKAYLAGLPANKARDLAAIAAKVDAIIATNRQLYADYGLESQDTVDEWGNMFKHYVPLMREDKDGGMGVGQGFSIKGREVKHRTGSTRAVVDILANIAMQREKVIVRGEKNRVAVSLAGLTKLNQNADFWTFDKVPTERVLNESTGLIESRADPMFKSQPNVIVAKIKGRNGNVEERAVVFNERNERAMRMAQALKNLDVAQLEGVMGVSAKITRYFSSINTQYNPVFGFVNLTRDLQGAVLNLNSTPLRNHKVSIFAQAFPALVGIYRDARAERKGGTTNSNWAALWEEFTLEGGQTGYRDMFATSADRAEAIKSALDPNRWMDSKIGKVFTLGGVLKVPLKVARVTPATKWLFDWLSDFNLMMENGVRLSAYKVGLEQGMSKQKAASLAKNLTVNFNRKGQAGQQAGALYAFFNASMQGTARIGETMLRMDGGNIKSARLTGAGKVILGGGVLLGAMQAVILAAMGFDDDEPPEFVRERNMIIPIGGKDYITIPMPLGYHVFPNIGRMLAEVAMDGGKDAGKRMFDLLGVMAEAFNPLGGTLSLQTIAPTAIDPFVALGTNEDWTGKPIYREDFSSLDPSPGFTRTKDTASSWGKWLSESINHITGGTDYTPGKLSPTADEIDYLVAQVTGGVGRELGKASETVGAMFSGEELPTYKIPLVGRFYGSSEGSAAQSSRFYSNLKKANAAEAEIKGRIEDGLSVDDYIATHPESAIVMYGNQAQRSVSQMRRLKLQKIQERAPREEIKAIEADIIGVMTSFNELADEAK